MKVLLLDGLKRDTKSSVPFYLAQRYETKVVNVVTPDMEMLCQKYDTWSNIPRKEISSAMNIMMERVSDEISKINPDVIVGLGYGACILSNLVVDFYWEGPSVFVDPEGYFYSSQVDEGDDKTYFGKSVWIFRKSDRTANKKIIEKLDHYKNGMCLLTPDKKGVESIIDTGILGPVINSMSD